MTSSGERAARSRGGGSRPPARRLPLPRVTRRGLLHGELQPTAPGLTPSAWHRLSPAGAAWLRVSAAELEGVNE